VREFIEITKALSDSNRVRLLCALRNGELCVCQLIELLGLAPSTVSKHLTILKHARLIECRKEGRWVFYRIDEIASPDAKKALDLVFGCVSDSDEILRDDRKMVEILKIGREELCRKTELKE
jgi:DNA-binding transcriptional ArsR family regulator